MEGAVATAAQRLVMPLPCSTQSPLEIAQATLVVSKMLYDHGDRIEDSIAVPRCETVTMPGLMYL